MSTETDKTPTAPAEAGDCGRSSLATGSADWQIASIISDTEYEEVNCNGGDRRRITKSRCACGQPVLVEHDANRGGVRRTCRADGKRVFYPNRPDVGWCVFRCEGCGEPIDLTCPDAAYSLQNTRDDRRRATDSAQPNGA